MYFLYPRTRMQMDRVVMYLCIQGDGRKFLDRFKSYFGSRISPQSLNEVRIYRLQPKSGTKGDLFIVFCFSLPHMFLFLIFSNQRHGLRMANEADEVLLGKRPRQLKTTENLRKKCQSENVES